MQVNVDGTANVVNLAVDFGVKKFIHVSSIAALGRTKERPELDEQSKWVASKNNTQYAISKYMSEQEVWRGHFEGLPTAIVNPAIVLGSGFWNAGSARFFQQVDAGLPFWPIGCSGFVDVRDVAQFMLRLLEGDVAGERFILNAQNMAFRDFFHLVAHDLGKKPPSIKVAPWLGEVAWRVEWLKEKLLGVAPIVTKESARSSVSQFRYANQKSLTMPGFAYRPVAETVQETAAQFVAAKAAGAKSGVLPF